MPKFGRKDARPSVITLADQARDEGQWERAAGYYRDALQRRPQNPPIWVQYGHVRKESGDFSEAEGAYLTAIAYNPGSADAHLQLGHVLKIQGKKEEAQAAYLGAFALDPSSSDASSELRQLGWSEAHFSELRRMLVASTSYPVASENINDMSRKASVRNGRTTLGTSIPLYVRRSLPTVRFRLNRNKPSDITLADRARDAGQWELAVRHYRRALNRNPRNSPIRVQYGHVLKEWGNLEQAERAYRAAIAYEPRSPDAHFHLGHILKLRGKTDEAQASYLRVLALTPLQSDPLCELQELGWSEPLVSQLQRMLENPSSPEFCRPVMDQAWSGTFDAGWYLEHNPDVAHSGMEPFEHFLRYGLREGRKPNAWEARGSWTPVIDAEIHCLKKLSRGDEMALFVTHSPHGRLKPHVPHYLEALRRQGIAVVLIIATDEQFTELSLDLKNGTDGIFVRSNKGYDFAAWAHILLRDPGLSDSQILYFVNDSVVGPTDDATFGDLLARLRKTAADVIGLTENFERGWHLQSYFLAFKHRALSSTVLRKFISEIVSYDDKRDVINEFEIRLAPTLRAAGLVCKPLFQARDDRNPTIFHWKHLLESGFPFVKLQTIRGLVPDVDINDWREVLAARGYDVSLAQRTLDEEKASLRSSH